MLLPRLNSPTSPIKLNACITNPSLAHEAPTAAKMVEPPVTDIYLCDYCGADFSSLSAIKVKLLRPIKQVEGKRGIQYRFLKLKNRLLISIELRYY